MVCVGYTRVDFAFGMYINFHVFLYQFHSRWVTDANVFFGGIWALHLCCQLADKGLVHPFTQCLFVDTGV